MATPKHLSRLRQLIHDSANRYSALVQDIASEAGPAYQGSYVTSGTRCGNPNCKCMQGELHDTAVLLVKAGKKRKSVYVRKTDRAEVKQRSDRYRLFRQRRAELIKIHGEIIAVADEILESLIRPYVPERGPKRSASKSKRKPRRARRG